MRKKRPAVVVSDDIINKFASVVIVCPITDSGGKFSPIHVEIPSGEGGLVKDSVAHCGQVRAVDRERLGARLGTLERARMAKIGRGLRIALGVDF